MRRLAIGAVLLVMATSGTARAECPAPAGGSAKITEWSDTARVDYVHRVLDSQEKWATAWTYGWSTIGTGIVVGSFILADRAESDDDRVDNVISGSFALLIPIITMSFRLRVLDDAPLLREVLAGTANGRAGTCVVLARAEELLARDAADESFNTGPLSQVLAIVGNGALFGILAAMGHWTNAVLDGVGGLALSELQVLTAPTGAARAWKHYKDGSIDVPKPGVSLAPRGMGLALTF